MFASLFSRPDLSPEVAPEARTAKRAPDQVVLCAPPDPFRISGSKRFDVVGHPRTAVKASDEPAHVVRKDVRKTPAAPQATRIGQRPGVVRVPTFQVQLTRPTTGRLE